VAISFCKVGGVPSALGLPAGEVVMEGKSLDEQFLRPGRGPPFAVPHDVRVELTPLALSQTQSDPTKPPY